MSSPLTVEQACDVAERVLGVKPHPGTVRNWCVRGIRYKGNVHKLSFKVIQRGLISIRVIEPVELERWLKWLQSHDWSNQLGRNIREAEAEA